MLVNIANEAGKEESDYGQFYSRYKNAISKLRSASIHTPLVIDAPYGGNFINVLFRHSNGNANVDDCVALVNGDPDHNLVFSWHLYSDKNDTTYGIGTTDLIKSYIDKSISDNVCLIFGEFGPTYLSYEGWDAAHETNYKYMIQYAQSQNIGWLPWIWSDYTNFSATTYANWDSQGAGTGPGNSGRYGNWLTHYDSAGTVFNWGEELSVTSPYSIKNTASRTAYENNGFK